MFLKQFSSLLKNVVRSGPPYIIIAAVMWSIGGVIRSGLQDPYLNPNLFISPIPLVFWEHVFGLLVISPFLYQKRHEFKKLTKKQWFAAALVGLLASTLGTIFFVSGLSLVWFAPLSIVVLMQQIQPLWAILSARFVLKESLPPQFIALVSFVLLGVYLMTFKDPANPVDISTLDKQVTLLAAIFGGLASVCWGLGTTLGRYFLKNISFYTGTFLRFGFGTIFSGLALLSIMYTTSPVANLVPIWGLNGLQLNSQQLSIMLTGVLITGVGAMLVYYFGLKKTEAKIATICELAWPLTTFWYDIATGKSFTMLQIVGMIILISAMTIITTSQNSQPSQNPDL